MNKEEKRLCSEDACYKYVDFDELVIMVDGSFHPASLKCWDCRTDKDRKALKNYKARQRKTANKVLRDKNNHAN